MYPVSSYNSPVVAFSGIIRLRKSASQNCVTLLFRELYQIFRIEIDQNFSRIHKFGHYNPQLLVFWDRSGFIHYAVLGDHLLWIQSFGGTFLETRNISFLFLLSNYEKQAK